MGIERPPTNLDESLKRVLSGLEKSETRLERTADDLDAREFIKNFLSPYRPEDSLEYMAGELVTLKSRQELQDHRQVIQELINKADLRQTVEAFVTDDYDLKSWLEERQQLLGPLGIKRLIISLNRSELKKLVRADYQILKAFCSSVEDTQAIESKSSVLEELKEFGLTVIQDESYQAAETVVKTMENFGETKLHIRYDYFDTITGLQHIKFKPSERWKEMLGWYLQTGKVGVEKLLNLGLSFLPERREEFTMKTLEFLIEQNLPYMERLLEQRKKIDFFLGAPRYVEKIESQGLPLTFPRFTDDLDLAITELYNPLLLLQTGIGETKDIVPNDVKSSLEQNVAVITGPNNTGKTVYVKSIGLAYALAQNGFPITAREAQLFELDGLFTHFVHPEDIRLGEGSYLDELRRIKEVFQDSTSRTLIILDEPIRGSSPEDAEEMTLRFVKGFTGLKAPTFLTTHLHSVSNRVEGLKGVINLQTEIEPDGNEIVPTYKIKPGKAGKSYGVEIADKFGLTEQDIGNMIKRKFEG